MSSADASKQALQQLVGARVRALRVSKSWTQEELAARADVDFRTIGGAERGERAFSLASLQRVAAALGVDISYLLRQETTASGPEGEAVVEELLATISDMPLKEIRHLLKLARLHKDNLTARDPG